MSDDNEVSWAPQDGDEWPKPLDPAPVELLAPGIWLLTESGDLIMDPSTADWFEFKLLVQEHLQFVRN